MNPHESTKDIFFLIPIKIIWDNEINYNIKSLLNILELTKISFPLKTTAPRTKEVINIPPPIRLLIEKAIPSTSAEATKDEITSGAPFPKANNVTAAIFWFILNVSTILVIAVLKNISLVEERIKKSINKKNIIKMDDKINEPLVIQ